MYRPVPPREKKTAITRSRTGCLRCRRKRRKCDEDKPTCRRCASAGANCEYEAIALKFLEATQWAAQKVDQRKANQTEINPRPLAEDRNQATIIQEQQMDMSWVPSSEPSAQQQSCQPTPPTSTELHGDSTNDESISQDWHGLLEFAADCEDCPSATSLNSGFDVRPTIFDHNSNAPSTWLCPPINQLSCEFGTSLADSDNGLFDWLVEFPDKCDDAKLQPPKDTPSGPDGGQVTLQPNDTDSDVHLSICGPLSQPSISSTPGQPLQQPSPSPQPNRNPSRSRGVSLARSLTSSTRLRESSTRLPWPKIPTPPSTPKILASQRIYLAHFRVAIARAFPVELPSLWDLVMKSQPVRYAALAVAAANLANLQGTQLNDACGSWNPMTIHATRATSFASESVAALEDGSGLSLTAQIITVLLIIYYELEAGSMSNVAYALSVLSITILSRSDDVLSLPDGTALTQWWLQLRSFTATAHCFHKLYGSESHVGALINDMETRVSTSPQMIQLIGSKAPRLWQRVLLTKCFGHSGGTPAEILQRFDDWFTILRGNHVPHQSSEQHEDERRLMGEVELYRELCNLKVTLENCKPPSEFDPAFLEAQPIDAPSAENIEPLHFSSHHKAMEVVDFAFAHIMCDESLLRALAEPLGEMPRQFPEDSSKMPDKVSPWIILLLRAIAGLGVRACQRENAYRRGIVSCLYHLGLFCPGHVTSNFIGGIVQSMLETHLYYEGPFFPLNGFWAFYRVLQREIAKGRTILLACSTLDEWATKDKLFSKGSEEFAIVLGREKDGQYFNDLVPMSDDR